MINSDEHSVVIIGSGPAGHSAALYLARAGFKPLVISGPLPGGQAVFAGSIDNYSGFPEGVNGFDLIDRMKAQAQFFGAEYLDAAISAVDLNTDPYRLWTYLPEDVNYTHLEKYEKHDWLTLREQVVGQPHAIETKNIIIATGSHSQFLGLENEKNFLSRGLAVCAACDGPRYRGKDVVVVGGGDTALHEVLSLADIAASVTLIHRGKTWKSTHVQKLEAVSKLTNVRFLWQNMVTKLIGEQHLHCIEVENLETKERKMIHADAVFLAIGRRPNIGLFANQLEISSSGHIATDAHRGVNTLQTVTSKPGVFAAGDVTSPFYNQVSVAVASGAMAAMDCIEYNNSSL
ncbi:MAG: FAD-dependent oxidoreductase [Pseudomonadales bacterium]|nr:FAD-dependent oxidoreductase [Pseudomonadales bacterium]